MAEPLSADELAAIRERHYAGPPLTGSFIGQYVKDHEHLLVEVKRLRTENEALALMGTGTAQMAEGAYRRLRRLQDENAAMWEIVQAVANGGNADDFSHREQYRLNYHVYASDEMREKARALLGRKDEDD